MVRQRRRRLPHPDAGRGRLGAAAQRHQPEARRRAPPLPGGAVESFWQPQPSHTLFDTKTVQGGPRHPRPRGRRAATSTFQVHLAEDGQGVRRARRPSCARAASRSASDVFWAVALNDAIDRETVELFRSQGDARAQGARRPNGEGQPRSIAEERRRLRRHQDELRRLLRAALPRRAASTSAATTAARATAPSMSARPPPRSSARSLPEVFDRFKEAAAKADRRRRRASTPCSPRRTSRACRRCSAASASCATRRARPSSAPRAARCRRCSTRIEERANYGETASGRYLADEFAKEPFGWDFEVVRLLVAVAAARREDRGDQQGPDDRHRHRRRGARHLLEQQPLPAGVVPPEEGHRVRGAREGRRGLPRHLRQRGARS